MGSKADVVEKFLTSNNSDEGKAMVADGFTLKDHEGNVVLDKATFLGMGDMMHGAFTGLKYAYSELREVEDGVIVTGHFEGTHTSDLDLSPMGLGVVPASGKMIVWPDNTSKFLVEGDMIVGEETQGESGGIAEFLAALGVKMPAP